MTEYVFGKWNLQVYDDGHAMLSDGHNPPMNLSEHDWRDLWKALNARILDETEER
jgi:hypothetical protein